MRDVCAKADAPMSAANISLMACGEAALRLQAGRRRSLIVRLQDQAVIVGNDVVDGTADRFGELAWRDGAALAGAVAAVDDDLERQMTEVLLAHQAQKPRQRCAAGTVIGVTR